MSDTKRKTASSSAAASGPIAKHGHAAHGKHADDIWGGYTATGRTYSVVHGNWTVPALNCEPTDGIISQVDTSSDQYRQNREVNLALATDLREKLHKVRYERPARARPGGGSGCAGRRRQLEGDDFASRLMHGGAPPPSA